jgi:hypothetical protein
MKAALNTVFAFKTFPHGSLTPQSSRLLIGPGRKYGIYLYPIIDVDKLGYAHVALNALVLLCVFLAQAFSWSQSRWMPLRGPSI